MDMSDYIKACSLTFWNGKKNTIDTGKIRILAKDEITRMLPTG